jgi:membrane protein YqaA with SNARE-associated domain
MTLSDALLVFVALAAAALGALVGYLFGLAHRETR